MQYDNNVLLAAKSVVKNYPIPGGFLRRQVSTVLDNACLDLRKGEIHALVGASGSGKTTLGRMLVGLVSPTSGTIEFDGSVVSNLSSRKLRMYRRKVGIVFQNPFRSLNPKITIAAALTEPLRVWKIVPRGEEHAEAGNLLKSVGLPVSYLDRYPHEMSGGERQRVAIARAIATRPRLLVADEAISSLDPSAAAEIVNLLMDLRSNTGLTCLFVTHDLTMASVLSDRISVMYKGSVVETGTPESIYGNPEHQYTRLLIDARLPLVAQ